MKRDGHASAPGVHEVYGVPAIAAVVGSIKIPLGRPALPGVLQEQDQPWPVVFEEFLNSFVAVDQWCEPCWHAVFCNGQAQTRDGHSGDGCHEH